MAYTTNELVSNAYYASGVLSREFETLSGPQLSDGINWTNEIITEKTVDQGMIPYETVYTFNAVAGQEQYTIPNLIQIDTLVFYLNNVRFPMNYTKRNAYFGNARVETIQSLPYEWYFERQLGGGKLYIYFLPDIAYPFEVHGIFRLNEITLGQDLTLTLDRFYITYLKYALSDRICSEYNYDTPNNVLRQLAKYEAFIKNKSRLMDLTNVKTSTLQTQRSLNWAYVNLGRGWVPS